MTTETRKVNYIKRADHETRKWIKINGQNFYALVDTGSDFTVIREDVVSKINCVIENLYQENKMKGVGGWTNLKSRFLADIAIDEDMHHTHCYVISNENIDNEVLIGLDIIMELSPDGLFLKKLNNSGELDVLAEHRNMNYISDKKQQEVEVSHICNK